MAYTFEKRRPLPYDGRRAAHPGLSNNCMRGWGYHARCKGTRWTGAYWTGSLAPCECECHSDPNFVAGFVEVKS
jgi:hypothetical protein